MTRKKKKKKGKGGEAAQGSDDDDEELLAETPSVSRMTSNAENLTTASSTLGRANTSVPGTGLAPPPRDDALASKPSRSIAKTISGESSQQRSMSGSASRSSSRKGDSDDSSNEEEEEEPPEQNIEYHGTWITHLCLASDSISDPPGIKTRPIESFEGCSYLAESGVAKTMSYVLAPLIQNLEELGYQKFHNFFAFTYDWRLPIHLNEERDKLFTRVKQQLEDTLIAVGKPAVVIGHSMGNRLLQYFSYWIEDTVGAAWLHKHIHIWVAAGAPWLGAPKMLRAVISGDDLGIMVVAKRDSLAMSRSNGSSPALFPVEEDQYFESLKVVGVETDGFVFRRVDKGSVDASSKSIIPSKGGSKLYKAIPYKTLWHDVGLPHIDNVLQKHYLYNNFYGGPSPKYDMRILHAPPIKRLVNIYGINLETEKFFFYKRRGDQFLLDTKCNVSIEGYNIREGIAYECGDTPQHPLKAAGLQNYKRSGDGTVPYESLSYPSYHWTKQIEKVDTVEIVNAEHRNLVSTKTFLNVLVTHICSKQS